MYLICQKCKHLKICREWLSLVNNKVNIATDNEYCTMFDNSNNYIVGDLVYVVHLDDFKYQLSCCKILDKSSDDWFVFGVLDNNEVLKSFGGNLTEFGVFTSFEEAKAFYDDIIMFGGNNGE